jgi:hypothetical protein
VNEPGRAQLVAAGVILSGNQYEAGMLCGRLGLRRATKGMQDPDHGYISSEHAQAQARNYGEAENQRHEKRIHVSTTLGQIAQCSKCSTLRSTRRSESQMPSLPIPYT